MDQFSASQTCPPPADLVTALQAIGMPTTLSNWQPLKGGQTNQLWCVTSDKNAQIEAVVVKLFGTGRDTPLFPNDPAQEAKMLKALAPAGLAPKLLYQGHAASGHFLIYAHHPGQSWRHDTRRAAALLRTLHRFPVQTGLRKLQGGSKTIQAQVAQMWGALPIPLKTQLEQLRPSKDVPPTETDVLLHGDPVPGNLLLGTTENDDMLIDWQCPATGDAAEDLALFLSPAMQQIYRGAPLSSQEQASFLETYGDPTVRDRLNAMAPWHHWRMAAYCGWKAAQGNTVYQTALHLELDALVKCHVQQDS
jgi:aminoglycoside phosphotransferase